ncbi:MAG: hypothetical protein ACLRXW_08610 [Negativibacillus massiliensis]|uniref:hypothetical protein n=1 Tax=Negativibacillus massiliensis TaxID=1871035 RepID=UPI00399F9CA5
MGENKSFRPPFPKGGGGTGATPLCNLKRKTKRTVVLFCASAAVRQYHFPKGNILVARSFENGAKRLFAAVDGNFILWEKSRTKQNSGFWAGVLLHLEKKMRKGGKIKCLIQKKNIGILSGINQIYRKK